MSFRLGFEKVFRTQQTVVNNDGSESSQILPSDPCRWVRIVPTHLSPGTRLGGFAGVGHLFHCRQQSGVPRAPPIPV